MGKGFGKLILFGEHFVVHGNHAIATAISKKVEITVKGKCHGKMKIILEKPDEKFNEDYWKKLALFISEKLNIDPNLEYYINNEIPLGAGLGGSAAFAVAFIRALSDYYALPLDNEKVNELAFECEKLSHGNPSGIDNTVSTYGEPVWFRRDTGKGKTMELLRIEKSAELVIGITKERGSTMDLVAMVSKNKQDNPDRYNTVFEKAEAIAVEAKQALQNSDWEKAGMLMNKNQELLEFIGVSTPQLELLCKTALDAGALGAKLSGGGGGGCMFALAPGKELQERVANAIQAKGFEVIKASIGGKK